MVVEGSQSSPSDDRNISISYSMRFPSDFVHGGSKIISTTNRDIKIKQRPLVKNEECLPHVKKVVLGRGKGKKIIEATQVSVAPSSPINNLMFGMENDLEASSSIGFKLKVINSLKLLLLKELQKN